MCCVVPTLTLTFRRSEEEPSEALELAEEVVVVPRYRPPIIITVEAEVQEEDILRPPRDAIGML